MRINRPYRKTTIPENAKLVFEGVIFDVYQWEQELFDGSKTTFEKLSRPDTAIIYPVLSDGRILLIKDSQPDQTYLCAPMGRVENDETPERAAARELLEETGYTVTDIMPLHESAPYYSKVDWRVYAFVGVGASKVGEHTTDPGERIKLFPVTFNELIELASKPDFDDPRLTMLVLEAKANPGKMEELRKKFLGSA
ncbi:MAG: NUDIX hydrolase [Patescibacteria group bacterium]